MTLVEYFAREGIDTTLDEVTRAVAKLPERDRRVLTARFGLDGGAPMRHQDVGDLLGVSRERSRQLEARALRWTGKALRAIREQQAGTQEAKAAAFDRLSHRAWNALKNAQIGSLDELAARTRRDVLKIKNLGRLTLEELDRVLASMGLDWTPESQAAQETIEAYARRTELRRLREQVESAHHTIDESRRANEALVRALEECRGNNRGLAARAAEAEERARQSSVRLMRARAIIGPLRKGLAAIQADSAISEGTRAALAETLDRLGEMG